MRLFDDVRIMGGVDHSEADCLNRGYLSCDRNNRYWKHDPHAEDSDQVTISQKPPLPDGRHVF